MAGQALFNREQLKNVKEFDLLRLLISLEKRKEVEIKKPTCYKERNGESIFIFIVRENREVLCSVSGSAGARGERERTGEEEMGGYIGMPRGKCGTQVSSVSK